MNAERHDLAWLAPGWERLLVAPLEAYALAAIEGWSGRGRPAVVARRDPLLPDGIALGIALPGGDRRRVSLLVAPAAVARVAPPLRLAAAIPSAPERWRSRLRSLDAAAARARLSLGVYGSLAWQHLSGEPYVRDGSDLDVLVAPRDRRELRDALDLLRAHDGEPRLDGEILLGGGRAVPWRELAGSRDRVLVKSGAAVALESRGELLASSHEVGP